MQRLKKIGNQLAMWYLVFAGMYLAGAIVVALYYGIITN